MRKLERELLWILNPSPYVRWMYDTVTGSEGKILVARDVNFDMPSLRISNCEVNRRTKNGHETTSVIPP